MPFYIRKSLSFGPIRFNLSKSGLGVSAGIRGFRVGTGPRGNYVQMGRGGLYYRTSLNGSRVPASSPPPLRPQNDPPVIPESDVTMVAIDSGDAGQIVDASSSSLVEELNAKRKKVKLTPIAVTMAFILSILAIVQAVRPAVIISVDLILVAACVLCKIWDNNRKTTVIFYHFQDGTESVFEGVYRAFESLSHVQRIWHIPSSGRVRDSKYYGGAGQVVQRLRVAVRFANPPHVKTNIPTPSIELGKQTIYFFPDKILVFGKTDVGGLAYGSFSAAIGTTRFVEGESVPADTQVVGQTWRYVNKGGGPDRRFNNNRQIPVVIYEEVHLTSTNGLNELLHVSRVGSFKAVNVASAEMQKFIESHREAGDMP
jgi:hypothetical protein